MKKVKKNKLSKEWKNILFNLAFAALTLLVPILFKDQFILASILLAIIALTALIKWKSKITVLIFIIGAIWGPASEMIAIAFNVWTYSYADFLNIPSWLFIVWGNAAAFLYQTAVELKKMGVKDK